MTNKAALVEKPLKRVQNKLIESERFAQALMNSAGTGIYIVQHGKFRYINPLFQELTGYSEEELLGKDSLSFVHPEDREEVKRKAIENLKGQRSRYPYEYRFIRKNRDTMWILERVTSTVYQGGQATVGSFMDVTERKLAEEELKRGMKMLRQAMEGAVQAMALIVESRDPYTAGHQRRVTKLACAIAAELGCSESYIDGIRMAASTHDIGKIYVPAEILSKPGELAEIECGLIKAHPQKGYDVLKEIIFPYPIAQIVLQHHERLDGSGYPAGLMGDDILFEAKILGVADVVEAMASHRPYRPALGIHKAMMEITENKGILYEPQIVDACVKLFTQTKFKFK